MKQNRLAEIANIPNSFILADAMEMPIGHKLPIWVAWLLY